MKPAKLMHLKTNPEIFLTINAVGDDPDWIVSHKRVMAFCNSVFDYIHNDEVHGVKDETINCGISNAGSVENT